MGDDLNISEHAENSDGDENESCAHGLEPSETAVSVAFVLMHRAQSYLNAKPNATMVVEKVRREKALVFGRG